MLLLPPEELPKPVVHLARDGGRDKLGVGRSVFGPSTITVASGNFKHLSALRVQIQGGLLGLGAHRTGLPTPERDSGARG